MRLLPSVIAESTKSEAERRVFGLLKASELGPDVVCLHSLSLSQHDYKMCAEIDFLIVTASMVLVLEVKGGGVSCRDGIWVFTDRFGNEHRRSEGPFQQAKSAMFALRKRLEDQFGLPVTRSLSFGYGVVFPDSDFPDRGVEWDDELVLDCSRLRNRTELGDPLRQLTAYWERKRQRETPTPFSSRERLLQFLRPSFERVPSLRSRADVLDGSMENLTDEQYSRIDIIQENPRILCSGGAGTGKTFLALEVARRHAALGDRVLLACAGDSLASFLRARIRSPNVRVATPATWPEDSEPFDTAIVDEGQDLMNIAALDSLDRLLKGGLAGGKWRVFFDANGQANLLGRFEREALTLLESYGPVWARLTLNCRNTNEIVLQTKLITGCDLGMPSAGVGPAVKFGYYDTKTAQAALVDAYWKELQAGDIPPGDVTLLSTLRLEDSCLPLTRLSRRQEIRLVDQAVAANWPIQQMTFSEIAAFKGLENRFIIILDIDQRDPDEHLLRSLYVGMTRARMGLWLCIHERMRDRFAAMSRDHMAAVLPDLGGTHAGS